MSDIVDPARLARETLVFKAMASEARLAIIHTLSSGEKSVNELVEMLEGLRGSPAPARWSGPTFPNTFRCCATRESSHAATRA